MEPNKGEKGELKAHERLEELLGYGRFQKFQIWVFAAAVCFFGSMNMFQLVFSVTRKPHRCSLPKNVEQNFLFHAFENNTDIVDECKMGTYTNATLCETSTMVDHLITRQCVNTQQQTNCDYGYRHYTEGSDGFWSMSAENDWVCDKSEYGSNVLLAQSIGVIVNGIFFMQLSDTWGRRPVLHLANVIFIVSRVIILFITDQYIAVLVITCLGSTFYPVGIRVAYALVAEYTNEEGRLYLYIAGWVWWVIGICFLSLMAWLCGEYVAYGLATTLGNLLLIPFWWLSPESPRLLLTQGKVEQADKIMRKIMKMNKEEVGEDFTEELAEISRQISQEEKAGVWSLFSGRTMATYTFIFCIAWTVNDFFYIAGQMNVENLAGNQFVNFALVALTELPSVFIGEFFINRLGRRWSHCMCMILTTVLFVAIIPIANDESLGYVVTALAICAKTTSNVGWFINYVQNVELFPTVARIAGMNLCATFAAVVGTSAPYVILLGSHDLRWMYAIFALMGVVGVVATSFVPETFKQEFPESVEDIEKRKKHPYLSWRVWKQDKVPTEEPSEEVSL